MTESPIDFTLLKETHDIECKAAQGRDGQGELAKSISRKRQWAIVRIKMRALVKTTLKHFGYPPDLEKIATENILKQAELLADEFAAM